MKRVYLHEAKSRIARPNTIRDINKQIVLNYIRDKSPISRAEIARQSDLNRSSVSSIVDALQQEGLIEEIGTGDSTGGRKPTLLKLRTGSPVAIGVDVAPKVTTVALADLAGTLLEKEVFATSPDADFMADQIIERVNKFKKLKDDGTMQVGLSLPGIADQSTGKAPYVPYFRWHDWEIGQQIADSTGLDVTIDNDANAIALAELWFGRPEIRKVSNFITVLVGEGIGTGIVFDGQVYRGERGAAGEFGHMIVGGNAPVNCSCGSRDCWEAHSSENAIIARYYALYERSVSENGNMNMLQLINLALNGEPQAIQSLKDTAYFLGIGISNLIVGLSPQAVVVSGAITKAWEIIKDDLCKISERSVRQDLPGITIMASSLGEQPTIMGALSLVLARKFASAT